MPQSTSRQQGALSGRSRRTSIVPRHRIAFEFPARRATEIRSRLQTQLDNLTTMNPDFARITLQVDAKGRVNLQGQVPSEATRKLAAILVRLEPGVRDVHNELSVEAERK